MNITEFLRCRRQHEGRSSVLSCYFGRLTTITGLSPVGHISAHEWPIISLLGFSQSISDTRIVPYHGGHVEERCAVGEAHIIISFAYCFPLCRISHL